MGARALVLLLAVAVVGGDSTCCVCRCLPSDRRPTELRCHGLQNLTVTVDFLKAAETIYIFSIENISFVNVTQNAAKGLHNLTDFYVKNVKFLYMSFGVFSRLSNVIFENIENINLEPMAFLGSDIKQINISSSYLKHLQKYSFYDLTSLSHLIFQNLTIDKIDEKAINVRMDRQSSFIILKCKINSATSHAIVVQSVEEFSIISTDFRFMDVGTINVSTSRHVKINSSSFWKVLKPGSIIIRAVNIDFQNNNFMNLPSGFLKDVKTFSPFGPSYLPHMKLTFVNNIIIYLDPESVQNSTNSQNIIMKDNIITCKCNQSIQLTKNIPAVLLDNYCNSPCKVQYNDFLHHCKIQGTATSDICAISTTTHTPSPSLRQFPNNHHQPSTSKQISNNSSKILSVHFSIVLITFFVNGYLCVCVY